VHESALPQGQGWSPMTWQILEGASPIPVTLI
jgi:methionyl-tRNA formyltransferase